MNIREQKYINILGIDWGRAKVGIAWTSGKLAEPLEVVRYKHTNQLFGRLAQVIKKYGIEKLVVGVSEGEAGLEAENFAKTLGEELKLPVELYDETLSSFDAREYSIAAGHKSKKRRQMEDAFAASVMLQNYLDNNS